MSIGNLLFDNEKKLIKGCKKGSKAAQKTLYDQYKSKMFGVCLRYAKNHHNAEDLLQEGFVKVFRNIDKFRGEGSFEGWMRRIFINTAIEHYRKTNILYPVSELNKFDHQYVSNTALDSLSVDDIMEMVKKLSHGYRTIFNLYAVEGFSHKEIAEMLQISEGTSKSQLARARYILQKMIVKYNEIKYQAIAR